MLLLLWQEQQQDRKAIFCTECKINVRALLNVQNSRISCDLGSNPLNFSRPSSNYFIDLRRLSFWGTLGKKTFYCLLISHHLKSWWNTNGPTAREWFLLLFLVFCSRYFWKLRSQYKYKDVGYILHESLHSTPKVCTKINSLEFWGFSIFDWYGLLSSMLSANWGYH